ncbi:hypothetical protein IMCC3317_34160 [Kordia antarctica]|uniref:Transposase n=1 Tax=Kordia antarctica TaxID=1218801 RepID=A0A7L4ZIX0_9FLAO|nr:IS66 family insertion sequence element accessory protein TnpB [Kordia antarctica]QHI35970.1 hypothetical protein IMCC3317_13180 [Kordia antarctica]QHI36545.1 hypothetical protein IMCC3317_19080 [Kordia antarctica]QHI36720.1 hypothetical protein IMCC3317_20900 [Kordia antarctica]QHI36980.1 hypothetical protein IMCC3317_23510 [Kordia antarctica]QHI38032.1 hypothetical protein IMCC3317_34160 [Kordia antarctica]
MFGLGISHRYHLYSHPTDMRKSFDGLAGIIQKELNGSALDGTAYIFINKSRDKVKILHWEDGGFVLYYKRLESGRFELPVYDASVMGITLSYSQLVLLIDGISISHIRRKKRYQIPA